MIDLTTQLLEAKDCREVDRIVENNIWKLNPICRSRLCQMANHSKARIMRVEREKKKSWENTLN